MAELRNDSGALRFALQLVDREADAARPGAEPGGRLLAAGGVEYLDRRDGEWWPLVRLPPLYLPAPAPARLLAELAALLRGTSQGFTWRPADDAALGLQLGAAPGGAVAEVGFDLGGLLAEAAGAAPRADAELALFRFRCAQPDLVRFSDALGRELEALRR